MISIKEFFHKKTNTFTYCVFNSESLDAIVIDSVLDYDEASGEISFDSLSEVEDFLNNSKLKLLGILDTHVHADHLTGSHFLKQMFPDASVCISEAIIEVQKTFNPLFSDSDLKSDGSQFDKLFFDGEVLVFGQISLKVIATPGHTPACSCFLVENFLFVGDSVFMPDFGTGRCDFPKGSAENLYNSIKDKLYTLADSTEVYVGHDYGPGGREVAFKTSIGELKSQNIHIKDDTTKENFVAFRSKRDSVLNAPKLLLPSIQINLRAGKLPPEDSSGRSYIKIPLSIKS